MSILLCLFFYDNHATFAASVSTSAFILLVLNDIHSLDIVTAINARHLQIWANSLMFLDFHTDTFGLALVVCLALDGHVSALVGMAWHFFIVQYLWATEV